MSYYRYTILGSRTAVYQGCVKDFPEGFQEWGKSYGKGIFYYREKQGILTDLICVIEKGEHDAHVATAQFLDTLPRKQLFNF